ncbi:hypothetical protein [Pseudolactococcus laudensis]|uniref:hypothetical protein n=1 Tax=Pseudolactococcus laudensis TaxID=1494461 RepID=UPI002FCC4A4C
MKKIFVALTFLSLLFCGSQAYALDTGNAIVTNDTIGSDSGIKAPEFVTNAQGDIVNTPEYKAVLAIINEIKNLSNQTQGNNAIPITEETYQKYNLLYQGAISKLSNAGYDKTKTASAITTLNNAYNSAILTKAGTIDSSSDYQEALAKEAGAINAKDMSAISAYTSYMYIEDKGFFGAKEAFPKIINWVVQIIFAGSKLMFLLDSLILSVVTNIDIFQYLDDFVSKMQAILQALLLPVIFPMAMVFVGISAFKDLSEGKPFGKKILGVILRIVVAGVFFLPVPSGSGAYKGTHVITRIVYVTKSFTDTFTSSLINNLSKVTIANDTTEKTSTTNFTANVSTTNDKVSDSTINALKIQLFNVIVKEPFKEMNFDTNKLPENSVQSEQTALLATKGDTDSVSKYAKKNKEAGFTKLGFSSIADKFMVALASLFKGFVLTVITVGTLMYTWVLQLIVVFAIFVAPIILVLSILPQFEHMAGNLAKRIVVFTALSVSGLLGVQMGLIFNSFVEMAFRNVSHSYYISIFIQFALYFLLWKQRDKLTSLFDTAKKSVSELAKGSLDSVKSLPSLSNVKKPFNFNKTPALSTSSGSLSSNGLSTHNQMSKSKVDGLKKAGTVGKTLTKKGVKGAVKTSDNLRFGQDEKAKQLAIAKRKETMSNLKGKWENTKGAFSDTKQALTDSKDKLKTKFSSSVGLMPKNEAEKKLAKFDSNKLQRSENKVLRDKTSQAINYQKRKDELKGKFSDGIKTDMPARKARQKGQVERLSKELFTEKPQLPTSDKSQKRDIKIKTANAKRGIFDSGIIERKGK